MNIKSIWIALAAMAVVAMPISAKADYVYDVGYKIDGSFVNGDIVLNCDSCNVTSSTLVSWSLSTSALEGFSISGTTATFSGVDLSASPTGITFTPTASAYSIFSGSSGGIFLGDAEIISGGDGSGCAGTIGCGVPCANSASSGSYGACSMGTLEPATTTNPLTIATAAVPEPSTWAMMILGFAGLGFMAYRKASPAFRFV